MVYASGETVDNSDYNTLIGSISSVFGTGTGNTGYGGNSTNVAQTDLATVSSIATILSSEWKDLRNAFSDLALHQGSTLPSGLPVTNLLDIGDLITFFTQLKSVNNIDTVNDNKLNVNVANLTLATKLASVRTTTWNAVIQHEFTVDFGSENNARHFFNTGGEIRLSASRTGGSVTAKNSDWSTFLSGNSPDCFTGTDYFNLTTNAIGSAPTIQRTVTSLVAPYTPINSWTIYARTNGGGVLGGNGSTLTFRSDFIDGHSNPFSDTVDGTFTSIIQERRSTGVFVRPSPTFDTVTTLGIANTSPIWVTSSGTILTVTEGNAVSVNVLATDSDGLPDPITYSIVSGSLPPGLSLTSATGNISGTAGVTTPTIPFNSPFTIRATDGTAFLDRPFVISVTPLPL